MGPACGKSMVKEKEIITGVYTKNIPENTDIKVSRSKQSKQFNDEKGSRNFEKDVIKVSDQPTQKMEKKKQKKVAENSNNNNNSCSNSSHLEDTTCSNQKPVDKENGKENDKEKGKEKEKKSYINIQAASDPSIPIVSMMTMKVPIDKKSLYSIIFAISQKSRVLYEQTPEIENQSFDLSQFDIVKVPGEYKKITLADIKEVTPFDLARMPGSIALNKAQIKSLKNNKEKGIALKQLSLDSLDNDQYNLGVCEEVERTVKILSILKEHKVPHIIDLLGVFYRESYGTINTLREVILIMELGDGSLEQIFNDSTVEEIIILRLLRGLSRCLFEAELLGISHNDLKPMNIVYFEQRKNFKLIDFDISSITDGKTRKISYPEGTPLFMSPELERIMLISKAIASPTNTLYEYNPFKSDVYSLGLTILSLMGVNFSYLNELRDIFKILEDQSEINRMLIKIFNKNIYSAKLLEILSYMLVKSPERRCTFEFIVNECDTFVPNSLDTSLEPVSFSALESSPKRESNCYPLSGNFEILGAVKTNQEIDIIQRDSKNKTPSRIPELDHHSSTNVEPSPIRESMPGNIKLNHFRINSNRVSVNKEELKGIRSGLIEVYNKKKTNLASSPKFTVTDPVLDKDCSELPIEIIINDPDMSRNMSQDNLFLYEYQNEILDTQSMLKKIKKTVMAFEGYS